MIGLKSLGLLMLFFAVVFLVYFGYTAGQIGLLAAFTANWYILLSGLGLGSVGAALILI